MTIRRYIVMCKPTISPDVVTERLTTLGFHVDSDYPAIKVDASGDFVLRGTATEEVIERIGAELQVELFPENGISPFSSNDPEAK